MRWASLVWVLAAGFACASTPGAAKGKAAPVMGYRVVAKYPHSTANYTEGFFFKDGMFYEGTGREGKSALLVEEPATGKVVQKKELSKELFGEGIVDWGANVYEWTWQSHVGFIYDRFSLRLLKQFDYGGEGWGMTHNAKELITSDGSATLRFRNPDTFEETHQIFVRDGKEIIDQLNELEWIERGGKAEIWANVWHEDRIARISPVDGHVIAWVDLTGLLKDGEKVDDESVLNGIAYDAAKDRVFVTGKQWPWVFEITVEGSHTAPKKAR
jgi:glutamine cyclotransferase